jgi:5-oxoprolinase (ATP-hydrolysing)
MGGTSTDVSRYDGAFEMESETEKAGVRIVTPHLAIETVAAGGGSICDFDGERLTVGPASAGASPGPACYGAGGPLTLTDANVFLGRVPPDRFPFPIDRLAVERRLRELAGRLEAAGHARSPAAIAEGFLEVANARMAAAIRKISVARGYDVRDYVLVAFGGAGGQHACAVARELGMRRVLVPALAGLLSACGAWLADVRKFAERSLLRPYRDGLPAELEPLFLELEETARAEALADGVPPERLATPRRELEMRYAGQDATLTVDATGREWRREFEEAHRQLYGYVHAERALEVVSVRVECAGRSGPAAGPVLPAAPPAAKGDAPGERQAIFGGRELGTALLTPESPGLDGAVEGPAILAADHHTVVVEPGWKMRRDGGGNLLLTRSDSDDRPPRRPRVAAAPGDNHEVDPVRLEVFHQHFAAIAEEMGLVLRRSALSTNVRERLDFSCAVFDAAGDLVANAPHIPVHLGSMGECVKHLAREMADLAPGDVAVTNDPFRGGSHLPDITVVTPIHAPGSGRLLFYVASRAHHAEIGGKRPGSMPPDSRSLAEEGVLIRSFRLIERGRSRLDDLRRLLEEAPYPSRAPAENLADIEAQVAANRRGADLLGRLVERCGQDTVLAYMGHIQRAARRLMEAALRDLPAGEFAFRDSMDDGSAIEVRLAVDNARAAVDFTGSAPPHPGNLNATPAIVASAVLYCFRSLIRKDVPLNAGVLAPIRIVLPECFLNPPVAADAGRCRAVAGGNVETSQRIVDVILGALGAAAASQGTMNNVIFGNSGFGYYETIAGGAGAGPDFDGGDAVHTHMTNTRITDVEVVESRYPVRVRRFAIRRGSGGGGRRRGGDGVVRELEFLEAVEVSIISQRRLFPPYGLAGGEAGKPGRNLVRRHGQREWEELPPIVTFEAAPGDVLRIETPGGGGYGRRV